MTVVNDRVLLERGVATPPPAPGETGPPSPGPGKRGSGLSPEPVVALRGDQATMIPLPLHCCRRRRADTRSSHVGHNLLIRPGRPLEPLIFDMA